MERRQTINPQQAVTIKADLFTALFILVWWLLGIALAHGFWSSLFAITVPPYAFYLVVEKLIHTFMP